MQSFSCSHFRGYTATAPLKAPDGTLHASVHYAHFRGYTATAPLKAGDARYADDTTARLFPWLHSHGPIEGSKRCRSVTDTRNFRGYTATAPLKGLGGTVPHQRDGYFRGYTATAPLKGTRLVRLYLPYHVFPWLHSHGPIEGAPGGLTSYCDCRGFPWLHSHGPIEGYIHQLAFYRALDFRGYTATAPLKANCSCAERIPTMISVATQPRPH